MPIFTKSNSRGKICLLKLGLVFFFTQFFRLLCVSLYIVCYDLTLFHVLCYEPLFCPCEDTISINYNLPPVTCLFARGQRTLTDSFRKRKKLCVKFQDISRFKRNTAAPQRPVYENMDWQRTSVTFCANVITQLLVCVRSLDIPSVALPTSYTVNTLLHLLQNKPSCTSNWQTIGARSQKGGYFMEDRICFINHL